MRQLVGLLFLVVQVLADKEREIDGAAARTQRHHLAGGQAGEDHHADHQAILGSRRAAEEFDALSADESKRRLKILAKKMDVNKDGFIDEAELAAWVENSMVSLDEEETLERMREIDANADGFITWDEYLADSFPDTNIDALDPEDRKLLGEDEQYFQAADLDGDGRLNSHELAAFLNPENYAHMHPTLVKMRLRKFRGSLADLFEVTLGEKDTNGDGAIDVHEYLGEMDDQPHSEWHNVEKERFAKEYDHDGDGKLTGDEIRQWLIPDLKSVAKQEAQHLFSGTDKDKDGKLSIEEIVDEYALFVGSEATNYGEDLHKIKHDEF